MKKYLNNVVFAMVFTCLLLVPDVVLNLFWHDYYIFTLNHSIKQIIITFILGYIISFIPKKSQIVVVALFFILSIIEIIYFSYFNTYLESYQIGLVFNQYGDIVDSLSMVSKVIWLSSFFFILALIIIYFLNKFVMKKSKYALKIIIIIFLILPLLIKNNTSAYMPSNFNFSYLNTLFSFNLYILNLFKHRKIINVKKYKIIKTDTQKPIVIMIMGESLNYKRMHLFGWDANDTPKLDLLKKDKNFIYKPAISSGVNTPVSIASFFHIKREPTVLFPQNDIIKLANQNGYNTYWFSMQNDSKGSIKDTAIYAKVFKDRKDYHLKYDDSLIKDLKKIDFNKKTFVILHLRADHSPYEENIPKKFYKWKFNYENEHKYRYYSYIDSVLYVDHIISEVINYMKNNHKNFVIYFTSDHAEMLGFKSEDGRYGHSQLVWGDTFVPFLYYSDKYHKKLNKKVYNHYIISKMLVKDLGYKVINPNENGKFYINNVKLDGSDGWIEYNLSLALSKIKKEK